MSNADNSLDLEAAGLVHRKSQLIPVWDILTSVLDSSIDPATREQVSSARDKLSSYMESK